jgi:uncharacterized protein involved in outer membrane biogenesis
MLAVSSIACPVCRCAGFKIVPLSRRRYKPHMKWLLKWIFRLVILIVVLAVALVLSLDSIVKALAERQIRAETGMDVQIGRFSVGLLSPVVRMENFKLYNTAEFAGAPFIDIPELYVEYNRAALAEGKLHVTLMRFNLAEVDVVKNEAGQTNIVNLMAKPRSKTSTASGAKRAAELQFTGIDVLNLSLGKLRFVDLKDPRQNREVKVGLQNQVLRNVTSEADLYGVLFLVWVRSGASGPSPALRFSL